MKSKPIVIVAGNTDGEIINNLRDFKVLKSLSLTSLELGISFHPDLQLHVCPDKSIVVAKNAYEYYLKLLKAEGIDIIEGDTEVKSPYPNDIGLNYKCFDGFVIGLIESMDNVLRRKYELLGYELVNVKQGYAGCSILTDGVSWAISSDTVICGELRKRGIDVLQTERGGILLTGYKYGFIGGASAYYEGKAFLTGVINNEAESKKIEKFLNDRNVKLKTLSSKEIIDIGGLVVIN